MKNFISVIKSSKLFSGIAEDEINAMMSCLRARKQEFPKDAFVMREGDVTEEIGLVLEGSVLIIQEDIWGNRNILSKLGPGQTFATAFACAPGSALNASAVAESAATIMFLNVRQIMTTCTSACEHHTRVIRNLLGELAEKNIGNGEKIAHMGQRTTRDKLMSYLSAEARRLGKYEFDIPFSRQQLADYLGVERSGLSLELSKMQADGLINYKKNHFKLNV